MSERSLAKASSLEVEDTLVGGEMGVLGGGGGGGGMAAHSSNLVEEDEVVAGKGLDDSKAAMEAGGAEVVGLGVASKWMGCRGGKAFLAAVDKSSWMSGFFWARILSTSVGHMCTLFGFHDMVNEAWLSH